MGKLHIPFMYNMMYNMIYIQSIGTIIELFIFMQLRDYDKELRDFEERLFEFPINFVPSYPFQEDINEPVNYMQTRVPAWCDRVLLSPTAKMLVQNVRVSVEFIFAM